ncbi:hypothetical protein Goklo_026890, partial [Gossypium klotzschianum]|nr:hypothetical protein [Gossypium klotzschianum]
MGLDLGFTTVEIEDDALSGVFKYASSNTGNVKKWSGSSTCDGGFETKETLEYERRSTYFCRRG